MKKLYSLAIIALFSTQSFAQDLDAPHPILDYSGPANLKLMSQVEIMNISSNTLEIIAERTVQNRTPGHYSYFCWVLCYDTSVSLSPNTITLAPGASTHSFEGWMGADDIPGYDEVTYRYYDVNGNSDTLYLTFTYDFTPTGIEEITASKYFLNITGPNPANNFTNINYTLSGQKNAKLVVTNLIGSVVKEINLETRLNSMDISVADLKSGVYIYSLLIDGIMVSSKKLVVAHR